MPKKLKKEKWAQPKLIVLMRGRPEEAVLLVCKSENQGGSNPVTADTNCTRTLPAFCDECPILAPS